MHFSATAAAFFALAVGLSGCYSLPPASEFAYATPEEKADAASAVGDESAGTDAALADEIAAGDTVGGDTDGTVGTDAADVTPEDVEVSADADVADAAPEVDVAVDAEVSADAEADEVSGDVAVDADAASAAPAGFRAHFAAVAWPRVAGKSWGIGGASAVAGSSSSSTYTLLSGWLGWLWQFAK